MATYNPNDIRNAPNYRGPSRGPDDSGAWAAAWLWIFFIFLIILAFAGWGWWGGWWGYGSYRNVRPGNEAAPRASAPVSPAPALPAAHPFYGREVTNLSGTVQKVFPDREAFTLAPAEPNGSPLLVVVKKADAAKLNLKDGEKVRVTGKVEPFDRSRFNDQSGWNLGADTFDDYRNQAAVLAAHVEPAGGAKTNDNTNNANKE